MDKRKASLSVVVLLLLGLALSSGGKGCSITGEAAAFKAKELDVLQMYDANPAAVVELGKSHPGIADIITSTADGSVYDWVIKNQSGEFRKMGKADPQPLPNTGWQLDAWKAWKDKGGKVPWTVAASPNGRGINRETPETPGELKTLLAPLGK